MAARWLALVLAVSACAGAGGPSTPAADGVRAYLRALEAGDARAAYELLAASTRRAISYEEFTVAWKQAAAERAWQAKALAAGLRGNPDVGERAHATFADGKRVHLAREGERWRLDTELVSRSRARLPRDAVRRFADAIAARDLSAALASLTQRRRDGLTRQVEGLVASIGKRVNDHIDQYGVDRAELRWDENGLRYRIVLRKEDDEWRIDDLYIRPAPHDDDDRGDGASDEP